jgi:hypothetical protein
MLLRCNVRCAGMRLYWMPQWIFVPARQDSRPAGAALRAIDVDNLLHLREPLTPLPSRNSAWVTPLSLIQQRPGHPDPCDMIYPYVGCVGSAGQLHVLAYAGLFSSFTVRRAPSPDPPLRVQALGWRPRHNPFEPATSDK